MTPSQSDNADITVYDLAQRIVNGQHVSPVGVREVAAELLRLKQIADNPGGVSIDEFKESMRRVAEGET